MGSLYWFIDAILSYFFLYYNGSLLKMLILDVPISNLFLRLFVFVLFIFLGYLVAIILEKKEKQREVQLVLYKIAYSVNTTRNIKELFRAIQEHVGNIIDTKNFRIVLYDRGTDTFTLQYQKMKDNEVSPPSKILSAYVIRNDKPLLATKEKIRELENSGKIEEIGTPVKVWAGVPLKIEGKVIGAMAVMSYTDTKLYSEEELDFLETISEDVARSIKQKFKSDAEKKLSKEHNVILSSLSELVSYKDKDLKIVWANKAYTDELEKNIEDIIGVSCYKLWGNLHGPCEDCPLPEALSTGEYQEREMKALNRNKTWFIRANPVKDKENKIIGVVSSSLDITVQKRLEEQLVQSQKMETVGRLAGGVSHDFNNLLTAIKGYTHFIKEKLPEDDPIQEDIEQILKASDRATTLTDRLLAFSRRKPIEPQIISLNDLIVEIDKMIRRIITEDIELVLIPAENLASVRVDPAHIEQVIVNLVVNSKDAMPEGGKITIETANVHLNKEFTRKYRGSKEGDYVMLSIRDTGKGMKKEIMEHIFEPFFTTKEREKGTGLGLSTVYGIVKQHDGYIYFDSSPGEGTSANIYFPIVKKKPESIHIEEEKGEIPKGNENILVVEDEDMVRDFISITLKNLGYNVLVASNGVEAYTTFKKYGKKIHLLLTDLVMPKISGKELAVNIKKECPDIKILFTSGYSHDITRKHGLLFEGRNFLQKPFTSVELANKIREILDS